MNTTIGELRTAMVEQGVMQPGANQRAAAKSVGKYSAVGRYVQRVENGRPVEFFLTPDPDAAQALVDYLERREQQNPGHVCVAGTV